MTIRISNRVQNKILMLWHGVFSGGFVVAYISDDVYAMHVFAGYLVLGAIALRLLGALVASPKSPLALSNPIEAIRAWMNGIVAGRKARNPLFSLLSAALLGTIFVAAATGWMADAMHSLKDLHEGAAELTLVVIFAHIGFVAFRHMSRLIAKLSLPYDLEQLLNRIRT